MAVGQRKAYKFKRALKTAARLPARVSGGRGSGRSAMAPIPGEVPIVILRVQILGCTDVLAKDKNGTSDPFVVASFARNRHSTPVAKKTLNPTYTAKDATFDFPIYLSLAGKLGVLELIVWDKDVLRKDYLGEAALSLEDWFKENSAKGFEDENNAPSSVALLSTRASTPATGAVQVKLGFVLPRNANHAMNFDEIYDELLRRARNADVSLVSAPPTEGIGTIRTHEALPAYEDDGLSSDEGDEHGDVEGASEDEEEERDEREREHVQREQQQQQQQQHQILPIPRSQSPGAAESGRESVTPRPSAPSVQVLAPSPISTTAPGLPLTAPPSPSPLASTAAPQFPVPAPASAPPTASPKPSKGVKLPKVFGRRPSLTPSASTSSYDSMTPSSSPVSGSGFGFGSRPTTPGTSVFPGTPSAPSTPGGGKRPKFPGKWKRKSGAYNFNAANDILGIVMLEIKDAKDLPKLKNITRTGWDMDPFVVVSFGKKVFRTRVVRHSLNPTWDEKLLFHVRRYEAQFRVQLTVLDWDKLSSNDHVGDASFDLSDLLKNAPKKDEQTGLYPENVANATSEMQTFELNLSTAKEMPWEAKHNPVLTVRAKYQPYDALRQQFWRQYLRQYDTDDTGRLSRLELTSMLDSLGSTLSGTTIDSFFTRHGKSAREGELTHNEAIQCLEQELCRPASEKKRLDADDTGAPDTSTPATPMLLSGSGNGEPREDAFRLDNIDFSGPHLHPTAVYAGPLSDDPRRKQSLPAHPTEPSQQPLPSTLQPAVDSASTRVPMGYRAAPTGADAGLGKRPERQASSSSSDADADESSSGSGGASDDAFERVINVKNCPLCHRPRLNSRAEVDIVTHLAVCASQDWARVDRIVVGNFVTASQAQRKWYTKVISKVSAGDYKLGANSANIIVQNRMTGQLEEEKMQVYVRLGIRLLYKGAKSRMEGARARRFLKSMSIKQGVKYDSPESANDIPAFVQFHRLKVDEILEPIGSFKTFNEFFYRKLKPDARPAEAPDDPTRLVSAADCRMMAFETVSEATRLWIKGREFTVARLLGDAYRGEAEKYAGGALCIFRLAPQDYHRFHSPVDGTIGPMTYIAGEYYTVNPQAIRTSLDVYGENARKIVPIDSPTFGRVMAVCIGAMMVGSIKTTVQEGEEVKRGQEFGYFAFGGSTIVCLFEKGAVEWDEDLLINGRASLETLVRVGMGIGRARRPTGASTSSVNSGKSKSPAASPIPLASQ